MNWSGLALLALEYLPTWIDFAKQEKPAVEAFIEKAKANLNPAAPVAPGTATPAAVIPQLQQLGALLPQLLGQLQAGKLP